MTPLYRCPVCRGPVAHDGEGVARCVRTGNPVTPLIARVEVTDLEQDTTENDR